MGDYLGTPLATGTVSDIYTPLSLVNPGPWPPFAVVNLTGAVQGCTTRTMRVEKYDLDSINPSYHIVVPGPTW